LAANLPLKTIPHETSHDGGRLRSFVLPEVRITRVMTEEQVISATECSGSQKKSARILRLHDFARLTKVSVGSADWTLLVFVMMSLFMDLTWCMLVYLNLIL